jgi:hypothetical protein
VCEALVRIWPATPVGTILPAAASAAAIQLSSEQIRRGYGGRPLLRVFGGLEETADGKCELAERQLASADCRPGHNGTKVARDGDIGTSEKSPTEWYFRQSSSSASGHSPVRARVARCSQNEPSRYAFVANRRNCSRSRPSSARLLDLALRRYFDQCGRLIQYTLDVFRLKGFQ